MSALCMVAAILASLLKKHSPEMGLLLAGAVCVVVLMALSGTLGEIRDFLQSLADWGGVSPELFSPLIKTLGIAMVTRLGADLCKDAGQNAMAGIVEMAGSFSAIVVAMPLFTAVWEMLQSML